MFINCRNCVPKMAIDPSGKKRPFMGDFKSYCVEIDYLYINTMGFGIAMRRTSLRPTRFRAQAYEIDL